MWRFLHASSFAYPVAPDPLRRKQMIQFLRCVGLVLPCRTCRDHYNEYIEEHLGDEAVQSRASLVEWVVELHNSVNRRTGKKEWTVDEVRRMYETTAAAGGSCPTTITAQPKKMIAPTAWVCTVVLFTVIGLLLASQVRRIPN